MDFSFIGGLNNSSTTYFMSLYSGRPPSQSKVFLKDFQCELRYRTNAAAAHMGFLLEEVRAMVGAGLWPCTNGMLLSFSYFRVGFWETFRLSTNLKVQVNAVYHDNSSFGVLGNSVPYQSKVMTGKLPLISVNVLYSL